ncbi:MAG: cysteine--tRNA ligase [Pseudomonadota bacterium]
MTDVMLHDTRSRTKRRVAPGTDGRVGLYVCGPTVYDRAHIGNARSVVVFDALFRLLRHVHGADAVTYVRNYTDVEDKIIARAEATRTPDESPEDARRRVIETTTQWFRDDMAALGTLEPTHTPFATAYVNNPAQPTDMVRLIARLIERGHAYAAEGHVLFAVESWDRYGSLARRTVEDMVAGARVEVAPYKRGPMDFVLWKPSSADQPGWDSPWGRGRPGWHIECSAMAYALLGERFQVHGGGVDLVFPHHENERAQSCCALGVEDIADIWAHNGYLMVEGEKMSKSLGNFITVKDLRDAGSGAGVPGEVIRFALLATHYRSPLDWTAARAEEAAKTLRKWRAAVAGASADGPVPVEVVDALADDLNTPRAIAALHKCLDRRDRAGLAAGAGLMGLLTPALGGWEVEEDLGTARGWDGYAPRVAALIDARLRARKDKDFARADAIRDGLKDSGVEVTDTPQGPVWKFTEDFDPAKLETLG